MKLASSPMLTFSSVAKTGPALPFLLLYLVCWGLEIIMVTLKHQTVLATALAIATLSSALTYVFLA